MKTYTAGGVVIGPDGRVAVVSQHGTSWSLPKGHIDPGEDSLCAAIREVYEETGIEALDFGGLLGSYSRYRIGQDGRDDESELKHMVFYLFFTSETVLCPQDSDNPEARWAPLAEVAMGLTHTSDRAFFERIYSTVLAMCCVEIKTTFLDETQAQVYAREVVTRKLVACAQVSGPLCSVYQWDGELAQTTEWVVTLKTSRMRQAQLWEYTSSCHPYEMPQWLVTPVLGGDLGYMSWLLT